MEFDLGGRNGRKFISHTVGNGRFVLSSDLEFFRYPEIDQGLYRNTLTAGLFCRLLCQFRCQRDPLSLWCANLNFNFVRFVPIIGQIVRFPKLSRIFYVIEILWNNILTFFVHIVYVRAGSYPWY
jgi:hypothetical protein